MLCILRNTTASRHSELKAEKLIRFICEKLYDGEDAYSQDDRYWIDFCEKWMKLKDHQQIDDIQSEHIMDGKNN